MIQQLIEAIRTEILTEIPQIRSCVAYMREREDILAPMVFLEVAGYSHGLDPGTEELALRMDMEARVVTDILDENSAFVCQELALKVADLVHLNDFGLNINPGIVSTVQKDEFMPEFDPYICWCVEWSHDIHVGTNVFTDGILPHMVHINGHLEEAN